jgi:hypothetical protein
MAVDDKPTANVMLSAAKLEAYLLRSETKQESLFSPPLFDSMGKQYSKKKERASIMEKKSNSSCLQMT